MKKTITLEVPDWLDEKLVKETVKRLIEAEETRKRLIEDIIAQLDLDERDLKDFEKFREELWKKRKKNTFNYYQTNTLELQNIEDKANSYKLYSFICSPPCFYN